MIPAWSFPQIKERRVTILAIAECVDLKWLLLSESLLDDYLSKNVFIYSTASHNIYQLELPQLKSLLSITFGADGAKKRQKTLEMKGRMEAAWTRPDGICVKDLNRFIELVLH